MLMLLKLLRTSFSLLPPDTEGWSAGHELDDTFLDLICDMIVLLRIEIDRGLSSMEY